MNDIDNKLRHLQWEKKYFSFTLFFLISLVFLFSFLPISWSPWIFGSVLIIYLLIIGAIIHIWIQIDSDYKYIYSVFKIGLATNYLKHLNKKISKQQILMTIDSINQESNFSFLPFFKEYRKDNYLLVLEYIVKSFYENTKGEAINPHFKLEGNTDFLKDLERECLENKLKQFVKN